MKILFGSVIAVVLLGLYVYTVAVGVSVVDCVATAGCTSVTAAHFTTGMASTMSLTGGLVSALVIAELAVTEPGQAPIARALSDHASVSKVRFVTAMTALYLAVWLATGLWVFVVGYLRHPAVIQPLTDLAQSWLGLAVAAGYSYFGIKRR